MKPQRITKPAIETGFVSSAQGTVSVNGQDWDESPQGVNARNYTGPVIAVKVGRKLVTIANGGFYVPRTTH